MPELFDLAGHQAEIVRSPRARQMRLAVDPRSGRVRLTLPKRAGLREGLNWARGKSDWVQNEVGKLPFPQPIVPDMMLAIADEALRIDWAVHYARVPKRVGDRLVIGGDRAGLSARVIRWLKREALRVLDSETREIAVRAGVTVARVGVGDPVSRWGSCASSGAIRYSWRLILAPAYVRRATVAHEVAHRVHMNHGAAFHALTAELYGADPAPARRWLRTQGTALHWFGKEDRDMA